MSEGGMIGRYGGDREAFAQERGRVQLEGAVDRVHSDDETWSRIEAEKGKITRRLAATSRQPFEWDHVRRTGPRKVTVDEIDLENEGEGQMAEQINESQAVEEYKRMTATFEALGVKPIFAPKSGVLVCIPRELTGKALAKKLRGIAAGFTKQAQAIEDAAERQAQTQANEDEADF